MKRLTLLTLTASAMLFTACDEGASSSASAKKELTTERDQFSYAIGTDIGMSLDPFKDEVDLAVVFQGIRDNIEGKPALLAPADAKEVKDLIFKRIAEVKQAEAAKIGEEKKATGAAFLAENGKKEGVITTESGLQYEILTPAEGDKPNATDNVKVHYVGTLLDGTEFDSSIKRGEPVTFRADRVIKGWSEALQLMTVGSKYKLYVPSELGYGERGAGGQIGPNEVLIFEVELISIEAAPEAAPATK